MTKREPNEHRLECDAAELRTIINAMPGLVAVIDPSFTIVLVNDEAARTFGYSSTDEPVGLKCYRALKGFDRLCPKCAVEQVLETGQSSCRVCTEEEEPVPGRRNKAFHIPLKRPNGEIWGVLEVMIDISDLHHAEQRLRESEERFRRLSEATFEGVGISKDGKLLDVNQQILDIYGYTREEMFDIGFRRLIHPDDMALVAANMQDKISGPYEHRGIRKDGSVIDLEVRAGEITIRGERFRQTVIRDITNRKRAEQALIETQTNLNQLLDAASEGVLVALLKTRRFVYANPAARRMFGYDMDELLAMSTRDIHPAESVAVAMEEFEALMRGEKTTTFELPCQRRDGSIFFANISATAMSFMGKPCALGLFTDVTEHRKNIEINQRLEQQLQRNQKLESLGVLAGGIAHDFNNLLSGIFGSIEMAAAGCRDNGVLKHLNTCLTTVDRARGLTRQLLTFAKGGSPITEVAPLQPFVFETVQFALSGANAACRFHIAQDLWCCSYDRAQLGQVLENIVINAVQAMPLGGAIDISAANVTVAENEIHALAAGPYVRLSIRDSGVGMPAEILSNIFDPFFTTKQIGSGLGLATSFSIVRRHGGTIEVVSTPGEGSTFHLYLPAAPTMSVKTAPPPKESSPTRAGRILVVDDERVIRETVAALCRHLGHDASAVGRGQEAIELIEKELAEGRAFDAIILDLTIPGGVGGEEAVARIRELDSEVSVIVSSGYSESPIMANPEKYGFTASLSKPFRVRELAETLEKCFGRD